MDKEYRYVLGKADYNGSGRRNCECAITWSLEGGRFSMCAEVWNPRKSDCYMCGQCVDTVASMFPGNKKAARMVAIWERWHLNDMKAGTHAQEEYLRAHPVTAVYPESHYVKACEALAAAGLNPDPANGYKYGSAWNTEALPPEVEGEIRSWSARSEAAA